MRCVDAEWHTLLFHRFEGGFGRVRPFAILYEGGQFGIAESCLRRERVLRRNGHVGDAKQRVRARCVDHQRLGLTGHVERQLDAFRAADPVPLHGFDRFRPARHAIQLFEQFVCIGSDLHEPLRNLPALHQGVRPPAAAIDDLLIREHCLVDGIPVDDRVFAIDESFLEQPGEQPLLPAIVLGSAGCYFARPVVGVTKALQLTAHVIDVFVGPRGGWNALFDRCIFGGHTERIPPHRLQHVLAPHAMVTRNDVADGEYPHVPHVEPPARIGKHRQAVIFLLVIAFLHFEAAGGFPMLLCIAFDFGRFVGSAHRKWWSVGGRVKGRKRTASPVPLQHPGIRECGGGRTTQPRGTGQKKPGQAGYPSVRRAFCRFAAERRGS